MVFLSVAYNVEATSVKPTVSKVTKKVVKKQKSTLHAKHIVKKSSKYTKLTKRNKVKLPALTLFDYIKDSCRVNCVNHELLLDSITKASTDHNVDKKLVLAIIRVESSFTVKAKNGSNVGLNQVNLRYHKPKFKGKDYYDVNQNVYVGTKILSDCSKKSKGSVIKTLRCYNGGGDNRYASKVMMHLKDINQLVDLDTTLLSIEVPTVSEREISAVVY